MFASVHALLDEQETDRALTSPMMLREKELTDPTSNCTSHFGLAEWREAQQKPLTPDREPCIQKVLHLAHIAGTKGQ